MPYLALILIFLFVALPPAYADDRYPEPLATALANVVQTDSDLRHDWRFHVSLYSEDGPLLARFDGDAASDARWTLLSPPLAELTRAQQDVWDETRSEAENGAPESGLFLAADAAEIIAGDIELASETEDALIYTFSPYLGEEAMDVAMARHLVGEITIRRDAPMVEQIRLHAPDRFRPQMIIRIDAFEMVMQFSRFEDFAVPVLSRIASRVEGSAAFQDLSERTEMTIDTVEYLGRRTHP